MARAGSSNLGLIESTTRTKQRKPEKSGQKPLLMVEVSQLVVCDLKEAVRLINLGGLRLAEVGKNSHRVEVSSVVC